MKTKQLLFTGAVVAAVAKFHAHLEWKSALTLAAVAAVAVAVADNVVPAE